jgi:sugar/nucleoside kinase (ribokinase family)
VVITHGEKGVTAYGEEETLTCAAPQVTAVDTTGAGDVFAAGLVHALARGDTMEQALECGAQWGAASVCYEGTVPPPGFPVLP